MTPQITLVANGFYALAGLLGIPSLCVTLLYACYRVRLWMAPAPAESSLDSVKNPDAILMILQGIAKTVGAIAGELGSLGKFIFGVMASVSVVVLCLGVVFFFVGRGLHAHENWARIAAGLLATFSLLVGLLSCLTFRGPFLVFGLGLAGMSAYAIWTLWKGFAASSITGA
jgi:hypothetical protein